MCQIVLWITVGVLLVPISNATAQQKQGEEQWTLEFATGYPFTSLDRKLTDHLHRAGFNYVNPNPGLFSNWGPGSPEPFIHLPILVRVRHLYPSGWGIELQATLFARRYKARGYDAGLFGTPRIRADMNYQTIALSPLLTRQVKITESFRFNLKAGPTLTIFRVSTKKEGNPAINERVRSLFRHESLRGGFAAEIQPVLYSRRGKGSREMSLIAQYTLSPHYRYKELIIKPEENFGYKKTFSGINLSGQLFFVGIAYGFII